MVRETKKYMLNKIKEYNLSLLKFEELEKEKNDLFGKIPKSIIESAKWDLIFKWEEMDIEVFSNSIKKIQKYIKSIEEKHVENLKYIEDNKDFIDKSVFELDMFSLKNIMDEIKQKVSERKIENEIKNKDKEKSLLLKSLPKISDNEKIKSIVYKFDNVKKAEDALYDIGHEFFNCGPDQYQDEVEVFCYIDDSLFKGLVIADIGSTKNVNGCHRLYWVEEIKKVTLEPFDHDIYKNQYLQKLEESIKAKELELEHLKKQL